MWRRPLIPNNDAVPHAKKDAGEPTRRLWRDALACAAGLRDALPNAVRTAGKGAPAGEHRRMIWVFVSPIQAPPP
ncbi:Enoyl-[acyl-carrier-protein] reductase [FMN] [Burkholderia anthina]|nr:Enoyl-[acyl-carrier-protein] reductase [FMN] [Burkholderia anthina]